MTEEQKKHIEVFENSLEVIRKEYLQAISSNANSTVQWHPSSEVPEDDQRSIVRTKEGATFMFEPIGHKWPDWVEKWMYIPE